jgi:hypothetical protein
MVVFVRVEKMASKTDRNEIFLRSHSMEQTPWEARTFSASKEIPEFWGTRRLISFSPEPFFLSWAWWMQMASLLPINFRSILIILEIQVFPFIHVSPPKLCVLYPSLPYVLYALPKSSAMIWSPELDKVNSTNHRTLLYAGSFYFLSRFYWMKWAV